MRKTVSLFLILLFLIPISNLKAQEVDLLWQGETYTPPFYKGRALWSSQSRITLVAIPHGLGDPRNLYYKWTKTGTVLGNINGVGRNSISFVDSVLSRPQSIKVDILDSDKTVLATAYANVAPVKPFLAIYENNPLYGFMFHKETSNTYRLEEKEVTFTAFPFFFSVLDNEDGAMDYEWRTNVGETQTRSSVTYRTPDETKGTSEIRVRVTSTEKIMQFANRTFLIQYENN